MASVYLSGWQMSFQIHPPISASILLFVLRLSVNYCCWIDFDASASDRTPSFGCTTHGLILMAIATLSHTFITFIRLVDDTFLSQQLIWYNPSKCWFTVFCVTKYLLKTLTLLPHLSLNTLPLLPHLSLNTLPLLPHVVNWMMEFIKMSLWYNSRLKLKLG